MHGSLVYNWTIPCCVDIRPSPGELKHGADSDPDNNNNTYSQKPKISYVQLVARAIWEKKGGNCKVEEIYRVIMASFPYFQDGPDRQVQEQSPYL